MNHAYVNHCISESFFLNEALGVDYTPHCGSCKCGKCPFDGKQHSLREGRELALIKQGLVLTGKKWVATYPYIKDPMELPNNAKVAYAMLCATEKRLMKQPAIAKMYQNQMNEMMESKFARKLSQEEISNYKGPIHYICHQEVLRPSSSSTPCRIVFNSSKNFHGHVLNEYWAKGPDLINNLLGVLIRFRENYVAIAGDIRKMYHTISISILDQHTQRFLWRNMDIHQTPETYVMTVVFFGDRPAGTITTVALRETAKASVNPFFDTCDTIMQYIYMWMTYSTV